MSRSDGRRSQSALALSALAVACRDRSNKYPRVSALFDLCNCMRIKREGSRATIPSRKKAGQVVVPLIPLPPSIPHPTSSPLTSIFDLYFFFYDFVQTQNKMNGSRSSNYCLYSIEYVRRLLSVCMLTHPVLYVCADEQRRRVRYREVDLSAGI